jgi:hypothetical protein
MHASEIISRLLGEATTVEPEVEPSVAPPETSPPPARRSAPAPTRDPWSVPPDWEPGPMPRPRAEDESGAIESWLQATQQPIEDWEWDGENLRLLLDDGSTEAYSRAQLDEIGIFGQQSFAESEEPSFVTDQGQGTGAMLSPMELSPELSQHLEIDGPGEEDATGTIDALLGRTSGGNEPAGSLGQEEVIQVEGEPAEQLTQAVSDVVSAILGVVQTASGGEVPAIGDESGAESEPDDEGDNKPPKKKKDGKKEEKSKKDDDDKEDDSDKKEDDEEEKTKDKENDDE